MSNISPLPYREVIKKLRKLGFAFRRATGGSHEIWWNETKRKTCIEKYFTSSRSFGEGIFSKIVKGGCRVSPYKANL